MLNHLSLPILLGLAYPRGEWRTYNIMSQEKYKPSQSEIKRAEDSMSDEQRWLTRDREKSFKEKQELLNKYGLDVEMETEVFLRPGGGYNEKYVGKVDGHNLEIFRDGGEDLIVIDGIRMTNKDFHDSAILRNYDKSDQLLVDRPKRDEILKEAGINPFNTDFSIIHDFRAAIYDACAPGRQHGNFQDSTEENSKTESLYTKDKESAGKAPSEEDLIAVRNVMVGFYQKLKDHPVIKAARSHLRGRN